MADPLSTLADIQIRLQGNKSTPLWLLEGLMALQADIEDAGPPAVDLDISEIVKTFTGEGVNNATYRDAVAFHSFVGLLGRYASLHPDDTDDRVREQFAKIARWAHIATDAMTKQPETENV